MKHISKLVWKVEIINKLSKEVVQEELFLTHKRAEYFVKKNRMAIENQDLGYVIGGMQLWIF